MQGEPEVVEILILHDLPNDQTRWGIFDMPTELVGWALGGDDSEDECPCDCQCWTKDVCLRADCDASDPQYCHCPHNGCFCSPAQVRKEI